MKLFVMRVSPVFSSPVVGNTYLTSPHVEPTKFAKVRFQLVLSRSASAISRHAFLTHFAVLGSW